MREECERDEDERDEVDAALTRAEDDAEDRFVWRGQVRRGSQTGISDRNLTGIS